MKAIGVPQKQETALPFDVAIPLVYISKRIERGSQRVLCAHPFSLLFMHNGIFSFNRNGKPDTLAYTYSTSTQEAEAERS
jgi:hypothetical protein